MDEVRAFVEGKYGRSAIMTAAQSIRARPRFVALGIPELDAGLGGGIVRGRMITVKGEYSCGKSALAFKTAAAFQRTCRRCNEHFEHERWEEIEVEFVDPETGEVTKGIAYQLHVWGCKCGPNEGDGVPMKVAWFDAEGVFDANWAYRLGVSTPDLFLIQAEYTEQGIDITDVAIRSGDCDLVVVDSVAQLTPMVEIEESAEKWQMGVQARLMNKAMRKWTSAMNAGGMDNPQKTTVFMINQIRLKIGQVWGNPETSPGGKGIDFANTVEIKLRRVDTIKSEADIEVGQVIEFLVVKNKAAPPHRGGQFEFFFVDDLDGSYRAGDTNYVTQVVHLAMLWNIIAKTGEKSSYYRIPGVDGTIQGEGAVVEYLENNPDVVKVVLDEVSKHERVWRDGRGPNLITRDMTPERILEVMVELRLLTEKKTMCRVKDIETVFPPREQLLEMVRTDDKVYARFRDLIAQNEA